MATNFNIQGLFFSLFVVAFLFGERDHMTEGFKQTLQLYFNTTPVGNFLHFETNEPNLDRYSALLPEVKLACGVGRWVAHSEVNYQGMQSYWGSTWSSKPICFSFNGTNVRRSIRHHGVSETTQDSLSLYEGDAFRGKEILVEGLAYAGITTSVQSLSATGSSVWTLFEGLHLEGKSVCIQVPNPGSIFYSANGIQSTFNLTRIGSVFKGCNTCQIEEYKRNNNLMQGSHLES